MDSAVCLAIARSSGFSCFSISCDYGQRHAVELEAARKIALLLGTKENRVVRVDLAGLGGSALIDSGIAVPTRTGTGIPVTYVPARNTILLGIALAWAEVLNAKTIFIGVNAVDYSGYPDCRPEFIAAFEHLANLGTRAGIQGDSFSLRAPLIGLRKADIIREGMRLGVDFSLTVSCYQADELGRACSVCDACRLRRAGFEAAGFADPTRYVAGDGDR
jgi:7-cyano-7-deazaguanine synthase